MFPLLGSVYLGWALGANNASNVFGTAVAARIITYRKATLLCGVSVLLGAILQGSEGIKTLSGLTEQNISTAVIVSVSAALTGTIMTYLRIPISVSQAVVGAIFGIGLVTNCTEYPGLMKIIICWIGTPIGSMLITGMIYKLLGWFINHVPMSILTRDKILWSGLLIVGIYGSYALGSNNVTNAVGVFSGLIDGVNDRHLAMIGGIAIAIGALTYSKRVIFAVGSGIIPMDAFTALAAVLGMAVTVHIFAIIGAPVSTSQGIVGSIVGVGILRGTNAIKLRVLGNITLGWLLTPIVSFVLAVAGYAIFVNKTG